jgi:hypothetical protein
MHVAFIWLTLLPIELFLFLLLQPLNDSLGVPDSLRQALVHRDTE